MGWVVVEKKLRGLSALGVNMGYRRWRQLDGFIELAVDKLHQNLHALQTVLLRKIDGPLRVFKVERLVWIGRPVPQAFQEKLRPNVL